MRKHVRVSEILQMFDSYADIDPVILEEKAKIGTNVHNAIIQDCAGEFVCFDTDRARAYFQSYKMWDVKKPNIEQIPRLYCDKLMITGECDGLLQGHGPDVLIDWKCSASPKKAIWEMQAHFYWYLLRENGYSTSNKMQWINLRHDKHTFRDSSTGAIKRIEYTPKSPVIYEFEFDQNVLDICVEAAIRYWEEKDNANILVGNDG